MSYAAYHAAPGLRSTALKQADRSPMAYRDYLDRESAGDTGKTASRVLFSAVHCAVLEPARFRDDYESWEGTRNEKQAPYQAWQATHPGKTALKALELEHCQLVARRVHGHPVAGPFMTGIDPMAKGWSEKAITWEERGHSCKALLDRTVAVQGEVWILDLKGVRSIDERGLRYQAEDLGWWLQMAHYRAGIQARSPGIAVRCGLVCYESTRPNDVALWWLADSDLDAANERRLELMDKIRECERSGVWPGRYPEGMTLERRPWDEDQEMTATAEEIDDA